MAPSPVVQAMSAPVNYRAVATQAANQYGVPADVFGRQIQQESNFDPNVKPHLESAGWVRGIAQFLDSTAQSRGINPDDPKASLFGAAKMMAGLIHQYGSVARALSAYNSGKPDAYLDPSFAHGQTANYVKTILGGRDPGGSATPAASPVPAALGQAPGGGFGGNPLMLRALTQARQAVGLGAPSPILQQLLTRHVQGVQAPVMPSAGAGAGAAPGGLAGGFLPHGAPYKAGRLDQGHDFQTAPGGPLIAPGAGTVLAVKSDPHGFGPAYPVVHFTTGPYAGQSLYLGHTLSALQPGQRFGPGTVLSRTGMSPVGNASLPGWAEIGYAPGGNPGTFGQTAPF